MGTAGDPPRDALTVTLLTVGGECDREARRHLFESAYTELRRIAANAMSRERRDHTLRPTALVHEAYVRLIDASKVDWANRAHFLGIAARAMRQILVDHARRHLSDKRGGDRTRVTLDDSARAKGGVPDVEVLDLHHALDELARLDSRMAQVVELRAFGGLTAKEAAVVIGCSKRTADDDWAVARLWLSRRLGHGGRATAG